MFPSRPAVNVPVFGGTSRHSHYHACEISHLAIAGMTPWPKKSWLRTLGTESSNPCKIHADKNGVELVRRSWIGYLVMTVLSQFARSTVTNPVATARIDNAAATAHRRLRRRIRLV